MSLLEFKTNLAWPFRGDGDNGELSIETQCEEIIRIANMAANVFVRLKTTGNIPDGTVANTARDEALSLIHHELGRAKMQLYGSLRSMLDWEDWQNVED